MSIKESSLVSELPLPLSPLASPHRTFSKGWEAEPAQQLKQ